VLRTNKPTAPCTRYKHIKKLVPSANYMNLSHSKDKISDHQINQHFVRNRISWFLKLNSGLITCNLEVFRIRLTITCLPTRLFVRNQTVFSHLVAMMFSKHWQIILLVPSLGFHYKTSRRKSMQEISIHTQTTCFGVLSLVTETRTEIHETTIPQVTPCYCLLEYTLLNLPPKSR
jgi:hypothetical protein